MKKTVFIALCLMGTLLSAQTITSNFDTNNEGWQAIDSPLGGFAGATYRATGGNLSGHISAKDILPISTMYFVAPAKFLGNKSWAYNNSLSFDLKVQTGTFFSVDDVIMEGNGEILVFDLPNPTTTWTTFTCPLNETTGWRVGTRNGVAATKTQVQNVLCNISRIWIRAEYFNNFLVFDEGFLDNVVLGVTPCSPNINALSRVICTGQSVTLNGKTYNQTGMYSDTIKRCFPDCDSIIKLNLTVTPSYTVAQTVAICPNTSYTIGTSTYTQAGVYQDVLKSIAGCDSTVTTTLKIESASSRTQFIKFCAGGTYTINNRIYTRSGIYRDTFRSSQGCDSIVITDLTVHPTYLIVKDTSICSGDVLRIGNKTYNQAGTYRDTLRTFTNCDSIIVTTLKIIIPLSTAVDTSICQGDFIRIGNKIYNQAGVYRDTLKGFKGCDSLFITTTLRTIAPLSITRDTSICNGSFIRVGNKTYNQTGIYRDTFKTVKGCDSILITNLTIITPRSTTLDTSICQGNFIRVGIKTYNQAGIYRDTLKGFRGCDSLLITTTLRTIAPLSISRDTSICNGSFIRIGTKTYNQTGIYRDTFKTIKGCDSILITNLTIITPRSTTLDTSICQGNFVRVGSKNYNQAGIYRDTLKGFKGCDSLFVTTTLRIIAPLSILRDTSICNGSFIRVGTKTYNQTGIYRDTFRTVSGCDSILITNLNLITPLSTTLDTSICQGNFIRVGTKTYNQAGIYRDTLKGFKGCDSLLITTTLRTIAPLSITRDTSICNGSFIRVGTKMYNQTGIYRDTFKTIRGCDSILITNLTIKPYPIIKKNVVLCANDSAWVNGRLFTKLGVFRDTSNASTTCKEITEWTVVPSPLRLDMGIAPVIELGDSVSLNPLVTGAQNITWTWTAHKDLSCTNCPNPYAQPLQTTVFTLSVKDTTTNCTVNDAIKVTVKPCESIFIPTAFSPNDDNANDYFSVFASGCVRNVLSMRIFNRWGVLVFSQSNFLPNNDKNGWDGRMNNQPVPPDVYVYVIELALGNGTTKQVSGDVTLMW